MEREELELLLGRIDNLATELGEAHAKNAQQAAEINRLRKAKEKIARLESPVFHHVEYPVGIHPEGLGKHE